MAIDFPRSTYTAAQGVSDESWPASPSDGDTQTNGAGDSFTFISARSLWVLDSGRTLTLAGGATYSWDLEKWIAQSHIPFRYFGPQSSDPTGMSASDEGDLYYNTVENEMRVFNGSSWDQVTSIGNFNILSLSQSNNAGGGSATFNGTATRFQLSETPNTAQQLIIALNGVIQEPHTGSAVPNNETGFVVVGQDIIFGAAPAANTPFWGVQMGAAVNVGTPSNGAVTNVHVNASAAIAGSKISPDFGSQQVVGGGGQFKANSTPSSGAGVEIFAPNSTTGQIQVFDRDNSHFEDLVLKANKMDFWTNPQGTAPAVKMSLDSAGKVGIGSTTPAALLEIGGIANSGTTEAFQIQRSDGTHLYGIQYDQGSNTIQIQGNTKHFAFQNQQSSGESMRILSDGKVGIGSTNPGGDLTVSNGSTYTLDIKDNGGDGVLCTTLGGSASFAFGTDNTERMKLHSSGRLMLNAGSDVRMELGTTGSTGTNNKNHIRGDGANLKLNNAQNGTTIFENNGSETMRIDSSGNVGIGKTNNLFYRLTFQEGDNDASRIGWVSTSGNRKASIDCANTAAIRFNLGASDAEKIRIDSSGRLLVGRSASLNVSGFESHVQVAGTSAEASAIQVGRFSNDDSAPFFIFHKSRGTNLNGATAVTENTILGRVAWFGADGTDYEEAAHIACEVDGEVATGGDTTDMPGRLVFSTTPNGDHNAAERMRIDSRGRVLIGMTTTTHGVDHAFVNRTGGTSQTQQLFRGGGWSMQTISGEPALLLNCNINTNGTTSGTTFARGGVGFEFTSGVRPTNFIVGCTHRAATHGGDFQFWNGSHVGSFFGGKFNIPGVHSNTTTGGSAVFVESDGDLLRSTSSIRYKTDVETIEDARADAILNCRPVWYRSKCQNDIKTEGAEKSDWGWYGFIAEEVAEIEPRLVNWATKDAVEVTEEGKEKGTLKSVERDPADYTAEGVRYDNFVPLLVNLVKRQQQEIETLKTKVAALEAK